MQEYTIQDEIESEYQHQDQALSNFGNQNKDYYDNLEPVPMILSPTGMIYFVKNGDGECYIC